MTDREREMGYFAGKIEEIQSDIKELKHSLKDYMTDHTVKEQQLLERISKIEHKLSTGMTTWRVVRALAMTLFFILAFKFGDISALWKNI